MTRRRPGGGPARPGGRRRRRPASRARVAARVRWAFADSWTITLRALQHLVKQPFVLVVGLFFPILMLLMFAYLLRGGYGASYPEVLVPGMLALTTVFGLEGTMTAIVTDANRGITDRFRSLPMAGSAVVAGRGIADMLNATIGLLVLMACGAADRLELERRACERRSRRSACCCGCASR